MRQYIKFFIFSFFISLSNLSQAQNNVASYNINSPYSRIGIGDLAPIGNIRNIGMGGTGVSQSHPEFFNNVNPALLINNRAFRYDSILNILDGGIQTQFRKVSDESNSQVSGNINFFYFDYAMPVNKRWTIAVGLRPLSDVSFTTSSVDTVAGSPSDTAVITYSGFGGLSKASITNAVRIHKYINLGLQAGYVFGNLNKESFTYLRSFADSIRTGSNQKTYYSGFLIRPGISFRKALDHRDKDTTVFINAGFTYEFSAGMKGTESLIIDRRTPANLIISRTEVQSVTNNVTMPSTLRFGLSADKYAKWNYALDFSFTNWKNAKGISSLETLGNSFTIAAGAEWAIDRKEDETAAEAQKAMGRKYLRTGFSFTQTPLIVNNKQVKDISVSLGYSFQVGGRSRIYGYPRPKFNLALVLGQRGSTGNGLIKDKYLLGYVGVTINDKWFKRRRIQ